MGRPALKKSGAMTNAERLRRHRKKVARETKLANPKLKAKQARRGEREREFAGRILALPARRYGVIYAGSGMALRALLARNRLERGRSDAGPDEQRATSEAKHGQVFAYNQFADRVEHVGMRALPVQRHRRHDPRLRRE